MAQPVDGPALSRDDGFVAGRYARAFFDSVRNQSATKLRVYEAYIQPWAVKLSSSHRRVWIVDGFAGPGRYKDGSPGSPELALTIASRLNRRDPSRGQVQCIFGETRRESITRLREVVGRHAVSAPIIEDDFWMRVADVCRLVDGEPALVFVDPFGLLSVQYQELVNLVNGLGPKVDLLVNWRSPAAARLAPAFRSRVDRSVGSADWTPGTVSEIFRRNLQRDCRFLTPASLSVRERFGGAVQSELILASRSADAYELWNDQMVLESERLAGADAPPRDAPLAEVKSRLLEWSAGRGPWRRKEAVEWHVLRFCGDAHTGTVKRAVSGLVSDGRVGQAKGSSGVESDFFVLKQASLL